MARWGFGLFGLLAMAGLCVAMAVIFAVTGGPRPEQSPAPVTTETPAGTVPTGEEEQWSTRE